MFIFKICVWIKSGNIFLAHPVYCLYLLKILFASNEKLCLDQAQIYGGILFQTHILDPHYFTI